MDANFFYFLFVLSFLKVHPSLVINMDQTGVHLVPSSKWTYAQKNSSSVATIGGEDKRQITACIASSLDGNFLPLQLIFQGKTPRCLPAATAASIAAEAHLTQTENHWSSQKTMQDYVEKVIMPYANKQIEAHRLNSDSKLILVLDVWAVHKSVEFRQFLRTHHPRIHLVFVPANCTSKLQVADVALQRPFKHGITSRFNMWAAQQFKKQIADDQLVGLGESFGMKTIKPLVLQWSIDSWSAMKERKDLILRGWEKCCIALYDVHDRSKRLEAVLAVAEEKLELAFVPDGEEQEEQYEESDDEDSDKDELDLSKAINFGERRSTRVRRPASRLGYCLDSSQVAMTEDSEQEERN
jgi:hypothetical protein